MIWTTIELSEREIKKIGRGGKVDKMRDKKWIRICKKGLSTKVERELKKLSKTPHGRETLRNYLLELAKDYNKGGSNESQS